MRNIACIGGGYWGKNLIRNFDQLNALHTICDLNQESLESFKSQYSHINTTSKVEDVFNNDNVHAVVIATPAETHYNIAKQALGAGKHVFVEKPLCLDEVEAEILIAFAKGKGLILMVGHLLQYHPAYLKIKEIVSSQRLGCLRYVYSNRLNIGLLRKEENALWSFAPHDISMILGLVGSLPIKYSATGSSYISNEIADITMSNMSFESNVNAHIFVSWLNPFKEQKLVVVCETGMLVFDDTLGWENKLAEYDHQVEWQDGTPMVVKANPKYIEITEIEPLADECRHFIDCFTNGYRPRTDGEEALGVLKVLNRLQERMGRV